MSIKKDIIKNINNLDEDECKEMLIDIIMNSYMEVSWPECQKYESKKWFKKEAILNIDIANGYLIPTKYTL